MAAKRSPSPTPMSNVTKKTCHAATECPNCSEGMLIAQIRSQPRGVQLIIGERHKVVAAKAYLERLNGHLEEKLDGFGNWTSSNYNEYFVEDVDEDDFIGLRTFIMTEEAIAVKARYMIAGIWAFYESLDNAFHNYRSQGLPIEDDGYSLPSLDLLQTVLVDRLHTDVNKGGSWLYHLAREPEHVRKSEVVTRAKAIVREWAEEVYIDTWTV